MVFEVRRTEASQTDLEALFDHLFTSYVEFGESPEAAFMKASQRVGRIDASLEKLGLAPYQGTIWHEVSPRLRWTTKDRAIIYFSVEPDERFVTVVAVFFGGQDHRAHMLARILS